MTEITKGGNDFISYDYKEISTPSDQTSLYLDGYGRFGWALDQNMAPVTKKGGQIVLKLKRDRKILHKTELTRLQRHFEACMDEINNLKKSKNRTATMIAILIGLGGTVCMTLSTFAITHEPPMVAPCFIYKIILKQRSAKITPLIEQKYDELYEICEKGNHLLSS